MKKQKARRKFCLLLAIIMVIAIGIPCLATENQQQVEAKEEETKNIVALTEEEKEYIQKNPTISIAIDTSWIPYGFMQSDETCSGVIPNVMKMVADSVGLQVEFVAKETYADAIKACNQGETMLVSGIANDSKMAKKNDVLITNPYIEINYSAVTKNEIEDLYTQGANYRVALCVGTYAKMAMQEKMPSYEFEEYHSNQECMDAVLKDEADIALVANYSAGYFSSWHEYNKLQIIQINDFSWGLCFGVNKNCNPILIQILNKGIANLNENDINQAIYEGATDATSSTRRLSDVFYEQPIWIALIAGVMVALILIFFFIIFLQRRKEEELVKEKSFEEEMKVKQALQESANIVEAAMRSASMLVWSYDATTHLITQNESSLKQYRYRKTIEDVPESLIRQGYVHPDYITAYRTFFSAIENTVEPIQGEFLVKNSENTGYIWERIILTPVFENGKLKKAIGTSINITTHKEKESQYRKLVDYNEAFDNEELLAKGRYNLSKNKMLYYFRKTDETLQLPEDSTFDYALEQMALTAMIPSEGEKLRKVLERKTLLENFSTGKTDGGFEYKRSHADGTFFWSLLKYSMFQEPNSENVIFFAYTYDISERVLESRILAQLSSNEYETLCLIDATTHHYTLRNTTSAYDTLMVKPEGDFDTFAPMRIGKFVVPEQREMVMRQFTVENIVDELKKQRKYDIIYSIIASDGKIHRKKSQFCYLDETKTTLLYYRADITQQYNREQQQLLQTEYALRQARLASDSKTEFFSRMSHDMRTPMNGILGMVDLSEDEVDPKVLKQNLAKIKSSGKYLLGLINDTLDFQKIESGRLELSPQVVHTQELLENITGMIKTAAEEKGVDFKLILKNIDTNWYIKVDPLRMKQIFVNLLSNAVKFTPKGGSIEFKLELLKREGAISQERITVRDTGIGMSEEFVKNGIFKPFSQEYNATTAHYAGTGLGLSIAKKLVELMGGSISVESKLGVGTKFIVNIGFERVDASDYTNAAKADEARQMNAFEVLRGKKILLAEDHPLNAEIAIKLLKKAKCEVTWAKDGKECVEIIKKAKEHQYDVILMDLRMPVMDGLAATKAIRRLSKNQDIPIIAMTANAYAEDVASCLEAGMQAHIAKPIEPLVMYETIAKQLEKLKQ